MLASPAIAPTLNAAKIVPDPKSQFGPPAAAVQVQNASPFVLQVTIDGSQNVIQSFTAQTFDTDSSGTSLVFVPTSGPSGTQGSVTCVWLALNEDPPMTDGQLTGAAQYAVGLGTALTGGTANVGSPLTIGIPPTTRTLVLEVNTATIGIGVTGVQSGFTYRIQSAPYLSASGPGNGLIIVPVMGVIDSQVQIEAGAAVTVSAWADTLQYEESAFYNGPPESAAETSAAVGNTTLLNGPFRLLSAAVWGNAANSNAAITIAGEQRLLGEFGGQASLTFPAPGIIIPVNGSLIFQNLAAVSATAGIVWAYP